MHEEQQSSTELKLIFTEKVKSDVQNKKIKKVLSKLDEINRHKEHLEKELKEFRKIKELYKKIASKADSEFCRTKQNYILHLSDRFFDKDFAKWHKELLYDLIMSQYRLLEEKEYYSDILDENKKKVKTYYSEKVNPLDKEGAKRLYDDLKRKGFGKDDEEFTPENFQDPEFRKRFGKKLEDDFRRKEEEERIRKLKQRAIDTDLDFHRIYKKLVKLAHPDLACSDEDKQEREYLMKRLTIAWENRDYYEILILHKIIDKENSIEIILSDENADNIIFQLEEKIKELRYERYMTTSRDGDNAVYVRFHSKYEVIIKEKIEDYVEYLKESAERTQRYMETDFKSKASTKRYLQKLYEEIAE